MKLDDFIKEEKKPWEDEGIEWREVKIKDVCKRRSENVIPDGDKDIYVGLEHIQSGEIELKRWEYSGKVKSTKYRFYPNDILYGKLRPYLDKAAVATKEGICSTDFIVIQAIEDKILPYYLVFFLHTKSFVDYTTSMMKGVHLPRVSWSTIKNVKIPLPFRNGKPDLETQRKIVEYIEANFSRIDGIIERKKREMEHLDKLWESALEQAFRPKAGVEWREVKLKEIVREKPRYGLTAKAKNDGKYVFLRITDMDNEGNIKNNSFKYIDLSDDEAMKYTVKKGDLFLARSGSVGNYFVAFKDYPDWVYASYLIRFRLDLEMVDLLFIKYFFTSSDFRNWVNFKKREGAQPNINAAEYSSFKLRIPFRNGKPDLEKQKEIAHYLDSVYEKIRVLKEKVQNQISQLEEMKESILEEVFNHGG